jgi:glycosyltransferase involved in cell wall biosynthesis
LDIDVAYSDDPSIASVPRNLAGSVLDNRSSYTSYFSDPKRYLGVRFLIKQCLDFIDTLEYDLHHIHAHFLRWNKVPAAVIAKDLEITSSLTTHAYDLYASPSNNTLTTTCKAFDRILTISEYNKEFLEVEVDPTADIEVIRMGIRTSKFKPSASPSAPQIFTISRFVEKKGIEYAFRAVARCVDEYPDLEYRIVGSGPRKQRYETVIDNLGIRDHVSFLGRVSDEQLIRELNDASCFLLPCVVAKDGDRDGIPVAIMEAMAIETPPISTYISGIPELIEDGKNGYLCPERSVSEIASAIRRCLSADDDSVGAAARETIRRRHDIGIVGSQLEATFI